MQTAPHFACTRLDHDRSNTNALARVAICPLDRIRQAKQAPDQLRRRAVRRYVGIRSEIQRPLLLGDAGAGAFDDHRRLARQATYRTHSLETTRFWFAKVN